MTQIIVFSKDRAAQLDLLLRSMYQFVEPTPLNVHVLFAVSQKEYLDGYEKLATMYPTVVFKREVSFKNDLIDLVETHLYEHTMFLVDDDVFFRETNINDVDENIRSFRLGKNIKYCYTRSMIVNTPDTLVFNWQNYSGDFGYPMSLDGNVVETSKILPLLKDRFYYNPNTLETALVQPPFISDNIRMSEYSSIVGNAVNMVQTSYNNRHGGNPKNSPQYLNERFLDGYGLSLRPFLVGCGGLKHIAVSSPHMEIDYEFYKD